MKNGDVTPLQGVMESEAKPVDGAGMFESISITPAPAREREQKPGTYEDEVTEGILTPAEAFRDITLRETITYFGVIIVGAILVALISNFIYPVAPLP